MANFDYHTLSITVDHTLEEYRAQLSEGFGIHPFEAAQGDRSMYLRFRHEHAHFTSFLASGLADFYGVFSDYILAASYAVLGARYFMPTKAPLCIPLIRRSDDGLPAEDIEILSRAWAQLHSLRAFFFGFGSDSSEHAMFDKRPQDDLWERHFLSCFSPIVRRFYRLLDLSQSALPTANLSRGRLITSRSVMEAYALSIEIMNVHFRGLRTNLTFYSEATVRDPGPLYTVALEFLLSRGLRRDTVTMRGYLSGAAPVTTYYLVAAISFVALQVPVVQTLEGEVQFGGRVSDLSVAHRFTLLVEAMRAGRLPPAPGDLRNCGREDLLAWVRGCHRLLGDDVSMRACEEATARFATDAALRDRAPDQMSMIEMSWAARANFYAEPNDYILDGGLYAESHPCQVRHVRTRDGRIVVCGEVDSYWARHTADHAGIVMEAAIFGSRWEPVWHSMPEIDDQANAVKRAIAYAEFLAGHLARENSALLSREIVVR